MARNVTVSRNLDLGKVSEYSAYPAQGQGGNRHSGAGGILELLAKIPKGRVTASSLDWKSSSTSLPLWAAVPLPVTRGWGYTGFHVRRAAGRRKWDVQEKAVCVAPSATAPLLAAARHGARGVRRTVPQTLFTDFSVRLSLSHRGTVPPQDTGRLYFL